MSGKYLILVMTTLVLVMAGFGVREIYINRSASVPPEVLALLSSGHGPSVGPSESAVQLVIYLDPASPHALNEMEFAWSLVEQFQHRVQIRFRFWPRRPLSKTLSLILLESWEKQIFAETLKSLASNPLLKNPNSTQEGFDSIAQVRINDQAVTELSIEQLETKHSDQLELDRITALKLGLKHPLTYFLEGRLLKTTDREQIRKAVESAAN